MWNERPFPDFLPSMLSLPHGTFQNDPQGETLTIFANMLLHWRNGTTVQNAYPTTQFPSIVHSTLTPITISRGMYSQDNFTGNTLTSIASASSRPSLLLPPNRSSGTSVASHISFSSALAGPMQMDVDAPDPTLIEELDKRFDVGSLAAAFGSPSLRTYFKDAQSPRIEKCPVLMHIMGDGQTMLQALMSMPHSHGAWKELHAIDFDHHRPTEAQITLISFKTSFMAHHLLVDRGMGGLLNMVVEPCA